MPDEYDGFLLLNKEESEYLNNETEKNLNMTFHDETLTPETNTGGKFKCLIGNWYNVLHHIKLCHIFTIIDKDEEVKGDWRKKCPTSLDSLRPFSFENRQLVNKKYKDNFPKVFLVAIKWNTNNKGVVVSPVGNKIEDIGYISLSFASHVNVDRRIFVHWYAANKPKNNVVCNKNLLNLKN